MTTTLATVTDTDAPVAAVLTRVSRKRKKGADHDRERSPEQQLKDARRVTEIEGRPVVIPDGAVYEERQSASRFATMPRKRFDALVADIKAGRYGLVILWEVDRGARELEAWAGFLNACRSRGVLIHVFTHRRTYDVRIGRDWKALAEDGTDAAYFVEKLSVNIRRGHTDSAERGRPGGRAPFGYMRIYDAQTGGLALKDGLWQQVPNDDAPIVAEIIRRVAGQVPLNEIHRDLEKRGVNLSRSTIRAIAMNPAYASLRPAGNGTVPGKWVPIVPEGLWRKAKAVLDAQSANGTIPGRTIWLLSGIGGCVCGATRSWKGLAGKGGKSDSYFCKACGVKVNADAADAYITEMAIERLSKPDALTAFVHDDSDATEAARTELTQLEEKLARQRDKLAQATTKEDEDEYEDQIRRLRPRVKAAAARLEKLSTPPALSDLADVLGQEELIRERWAKMALPAQKEVLRTVFSRMNLQRAAYRGQPIEDRLDVKLAG